VEHVTDTPAAEHVNDTLSFATTDAPSASAAAPPLDQVAEQGLPHIPEEVPPSLPDEVVAHIADTPAPEHIADHAGWLVS
jgi:hypothetical protein